MSKPLITFYTDQNITVTNSKNKESATGEESHNWDYVPAPRPVDREFLNSDNDQSELSSNVPEKIFNLIKMSRQEPWQMTMTRNKSFFEQAIYMADYEDDAPLVPFFEYFPVYRSMNAAQLRSYFTFRTLVRKGKYPEVSLSYIFIHIYELLMQIGITEPEKGLDQLENLKDAYSVSHPKLTRYLELWMRDYIAYYNLTARVANHFAEQVQEDTIAETLTGYQNINDESLFEAASSLSAYKVKAAALFKKYPDKMTVVASRVIRTVAPIYESRYGHGLDELCMGLRKQRPHPIFVSAIFYSPHPVKEQIFNISSRRRYLCKGGLWSVDTFNEKVFSKKGELLGQILHETDRRLRISLKVKPSMAARMGDKEIESAIQLVIDTYLKELEEEARPKIKVDFSKLAKIRSDADSIRDALLSEEDFTDESVPVKNIHVEAVEQTTEPAVQDNNSLFTTEELNFLHLLLSNGDWKDYLRSVHVPVGVMTDNINEKMMEDLNDILIDDEGNGPFVLEDYKDYITDKI
ncbi:TerB N-terminal domain-containing protein [Chitinophaga sancti]|uniref:TerB N-terminal domain-containing protein n=1 Tax=Chitinophaga sancti TaxID=1004 RepID=A0A1K1R5T0_9BACT|nr:TerB N-terminal domain-containing protein [Chitinophaga sancti]WQD64236.1 TerB N-terminal domain-containing protein [Chitinophaga sancti]WQG90140.1 TerB N-terminal domain-containing protein [Chitinophaga sancti]SFW67211.1 TerB-C domain-containing protein [Chitinophaga sancti]